MFAFVPLGCYVVFVLLWIRVRCLGASASLYVRVECVKEFWVCVGGGSMNCSCKFTCAKNIATLFSLNYACPLFLLWEADLTSAPWSSWSSPFRGSCPGQSTGEPLWCVAHSVSSRVTVSALLVLACRGSDIAGPHVGREISQAELRVLGPCWLTSPPPQTLLCHPEVSWGLRGRSTQVLPQKIHPLLPSPLQWGAFSLLTLSPTP